MHLTVIHPFEEYQRGDKIKDKAEIEKVLAGENASSVVRTKDTEESPAH